VDISVTGGGVGATLSETGRPRVNTQLCGDNMHFGSACTEVQCIDEEIMTTLEVVIDDVGGENNWRP
jgi:hypothetical protein